MGRLELLPYGEIASLKNKLKSTACRELGKICGITEMATLISDIEYIETVLLLADDHQEEDIIHVLIRKIKDAVQAADDFLDDIAAQNLRLKILDGLTLKVIRFFSLTEIFVFRLRIYHKLKKIQEKFSSIHTGLSIASDHRKLKPRSFERDWRVTTSNLESEILGREEDGSAISKMLVEPESLGIEKVSVIGIVGVVGIGKTAVAQMVYNSEEVKKFFEVRIWVYVSENFVVENIIKQILSSLHCESNSPESSIHTLERVLKDRKYLLVLDDVWVESFQEWAPLMTPLMCGAPGSKILVTTRIKIRVVTKINESEAANVAEVNESEAANVAEVNESEANVAEVNESEAANVAEVNESEANVVEMIVSEAAANAAEVNESEANAAEVNESEANVAEVNESEPNVVGVNNWYHLQALNLEDSLSLLAKLVFPNDPLQTGLESVGRQIVTKCRGVPLLIRRVANMLHNKYQVSEWIEVLEGDFWKPAHEEHDTMRDLKLSYQYLSSELKQCFVHCLVYPKGWQIEKKELIQLWMAQGYLEGLDDQRQMEDVGYEFLSTLQRNSFFQPDEKLGQGNQDSFKMHDLMYDLALVVAGKNYSLGSERANTPIHMCFSQESNNTNLLGSLDACKLRTIFLQRANDLEIAQMPRKLPFILRFKRLRTLNLSHSSLMKLPYFIGKLKHLRYLDLSWCVKLVSLPKSIGNLVNLQTLKLTGCEKLQFSTKIVTKLISLRHLEIHRCKAFKDMMPAGLGRLSSLQSLSNFYVVDDKKKKAGKLNELQNLNSLRGNLKITRLDQVSNVKLDSENVILKQKNLLDSLDLNWENKLLDSLDLNSENQNDIIEESFLLLENLCPHQHLKRLHVKRYPGDRFSTWLSSIGNLSHISLFGFDNCKSLPPLENLENLKSLEISSMKVLECIYLEEGFHAAATFFQSLETLNISRCQNFRGWKRMKDQGSVDNLLLPPFGRLSQLIINKCPKLTDLPTFPNVEELQLCESMVKPLKETLDIASSSSSTPLSMIKSLKIEGKLPDISVLPSRWKQNLTSLEHLEIGDVDNLDIWFEDNFLDLKKVVVYGCNLEALPSKMCDMLSLQHIKMMGCHKLSSLPKEMVKLTELVTIEIWDCPLLVERCQKETGADWPQIKHVKKIIFKENLRR